MFMSLVKTQANPLMIRGMIPMKYRMDMRAEKKMIVGNAWNARKKPRDVSPASFVAPGGKASLPKTNSAPADADPMTFITISLIHKNTFAPGGKMR